MISSTKELFRFNALFTVASALAILLVTSPLLSLSPALYALILLIVCVKILLTFLAMDFDLGLYGTNSLAYIAVREGKELHKAFFLEISEFGFESKTMECFTHVIAGVAVLPSLL